MILRVPPQLLQGSQGSYGDSTGEADIVSCWGMELRFPLEEENGCQASCLVEVGIGAIFRGTTGLSVLPSCREVTFVL